MAEVMFTKGMEVEVSIDDKDLRGALFIATVLRSVTKKNTVLVEYHTLVADDKGSKPLREFVNVLNLRPRAPREVCRVFCFNDLVDAYHNDGWWEGVVVRVLGDQRYLVYFRSGKEELEFGHSELRIHREWARGGLWVPPMEEKKTDDKDIVTEHNLADVRGIDQAQMSHVSDSADIVIGSHTRKQKIELHSLMSNTKISPPCKNIKKEEDPFLFTHPGKEMPTSTTPCPSERLSGPHALTSVQEVIGSVLDCEGSWSHSTTENSGVPSLANIEEEKYELSKAQVPDSQKNLLDQSLPHSIETPGLNTLSLVSSPEEDLSPYCKHLNKQAASECSLHLNSRPGKEMSGSPTTSPLERPSGHPALDFSQDKNRSYMNCDRESHCTIDEFSLSPLSHIEGEQCDSSKSEMECLQGNPDVQSLSSSIERPDQAQCRRMGKAWHCHEMELPGNFTQQQNNIDNEKGRKRGRESNCCISSDNSEKSNSNGDHLLPADHPQYVGMDIEARFNEGDVEKSDKARAEIWHHWCK